MKIMLIDQNDLKKKLVPLQAQADQCTFLRHKKYAEDLVALSSISAINGVIAYKPIAKVRKAAEITLPHLNIKFIIVEV